jgi:molecular chaperone HscB
LQSHFDLFGLPPAFGLDREALEKAYLEIQSRVHPDRFAHAGDAERRASMQWTTRVNEAYRILKDPVQRAKHLLELQGIDVGFETNTQMPTDFLLRQLELREELEAAVHKKDPALLEALRSALAGEKRLLESQLAESLDRKKDLQESTGQVRKLMFLQRLDDEIDSAYEEFE